MAMICHMNYYWQQDKTKLRNAFNNNISTIIQSGGFLGSLLSKVVRPLMKVATPSAKNVLAPLGIIAATSAIDAGIQKKQTKKTWFWNKTLNISNEEMNDIMKTVQALEG